MDDLKSHTISETSRISGASRTTIYQQISAGRLKAKKIGRRTIILSTDLSEWLASLPAKESNAA
jgi:excisionase family DNA binding protein